MRVTTANAYNTRIENLGQRQSEMLEANERMTSGKRVARASDDPTNAARAERGDVVHETDGGPFGHCYSFQIWMRLLLAGYRLF